MNVPNPSDYEEDVSHAQVSGSRRSKFAISLTIPLHRWWLLLRTCGKGGHAIGRVLMPVFLLHVVHSTSLLLLSGGFNTPSDCNQV